MSRQESVFGWADGRQVTAPDPVLHRDGPGDRPAALLRDGGRGSDRSQGPPFAEATVVASVAEFWDGYAIRRIADLTAAIGGSRDTVL